MRRCCLPCREAWRAASARVPKEHELCFQHIESYDDLIRRVRMTNKSRVAGTWSSPR
jgi:hypothetical protein